MNDDHEFLYRGLLKRYGRAQVDSYRISLNHLWDRLNIHDADSSMWHDYFWPLYQFATLRIGLDSFFLVHVWTYTCLDKLRDYINDECIFEDRNGHPFDAVHYAIYCSCLISVIMQTGWRRFLPWTISRRIAESSFRKNIPGDLYDFMNKETEILSWISPAIGASKPKNGPIVELMSHVTSNTDWDEVLKDYYDNLPSEGKSERP